MLTAPSVSNPPMVPIHVCPLSRTCVPTSVLRMWTHGIDVLRILAALTRTAGLAQHAKPATVLPAPQSVTDHTRPRTVTQTTGAATIPLILTISMTTCAKLQTLTRVLRRGATIQSSVWMPVPVRTMLAHRMTCVRQRLLRIPVVQVLVATNNASEQEIASIPLTFPLMHTLVCVPAVGMDQAALISMNALRLHARMAVTAVIPR